MFFQHFVRLITQLFLIASFQNLAGFMTDGRERNQSHTVMMLEKNSCQSELYFQEQKKAHYVCLRNVTCYLLTGWKCSVGNKSSSNGREVAARRTRIVTKNGYFFAKVKTCSTKASYCCRYDILWRRRSIRKKHYID